METKYFPSVIAARKAAIAQMKYYHEMMKLAEQSKRTTL
jgi:hypothetical protein